MAKRTRILDSVLRRLYAHSGNQCAFPGCSSPIFEDSGVLTGQCCHIKAISPSGPRYDAYQTNEERNGVDNLILLCSRHHKIVDSDVDKYTVDTLLQYKRDHEEQFMAENLTLSAENLRHLQQSCQDFWKYIQRIDEDSIVPDLKMKVDASMSIEDLISNLDEKINDMYMVLDSIIDSDRLLLHSIRDILPELGIELDAFNKMLTSLHNSKLHTHNWEMYNLATPNTEKALKMLFLQLVVKILEDISLRNKQEHELLPEYRRRLTEFQIENYHAD